MGLVRLTRIATQGRRYLDDSKPQSLLWGGESPGLCGPNGHEASACPPEIREKKPPVLASTISALTNRIDAQSFTAYWLPAFVAALGGICLLAARVGTDQLGAAISRLDAVQQSLALLVVLLVTTVLAFVLRAVSLPIAELFAGITLPRFAAERLRRAQIRARTRAAGPPQRDSGQPRPAPEAFHRASALSPYYPERESDMHPTLFGNILAAVADHPRSAYGMDGAWWWPRLEALLPADFKKSLGDAQAPVVALVNLSLVFAALALVGGGTLVLGGIGWPSAAAALIGGLLLSRLCYLAAVSQLAQLASLMRVAFDLYRHAILTQLHLAIPSDLDAERGLWQRLTQELFVDVAARGASSARGGAAGEPQTGGTQAQVAQVKALPHLAGPRE
jgi:hypothetical protein